MLIIPFSGNLLFIAGAISTINIYKLAAMNISVSITMVVLGCAFFLKGGKPPKNAELLTTDADKRSWPTPLKGLLVHLSPIYVSMLLNAVFGAAVLFGDYVLPLPRLAYIR